MTTKSTSQKVKATKVESKKTKALNPKVEEAKAKTSKKVKATKIELPSTKLEKKKSKVAKEVTPVTNTALMEQVVSKGRSNTSIPMIALIPLPENNSVKR